MHKIRRIIELALSELYNNDSILINRSTKEESINHWLAIYIDSIIKEKVKLKLDYNVDVEYNRDMTSEFFDGSAMNNKIIRRSTIELSFQEVIPDIIVHKRGSNEHNYLCIEAKKKYSGNRARNRDLNKILGLLEEPFKYSFGSIIQYLPSEDFFEVLIIRKNKLDYITENFQIFKNQNQ
jgi:hypothetical protein